MSIQVPPDSTGKLVETNSPDGTTQRQVITLGDKTATTTATVGANGLEVKVTNIASVVATDGTNAITTLFDVDSGAGTQRVEGVSLRKAASGGSVEAGTSTDPLRIDPTGTTIQPVSGTVATSNFPSTADTNSGLKSASTLRMVLATDQPALTNKLLVTPDSVALPANQSVNVSQINAVTPLMGNGVTGTGSPRVTIASDNTAFAVNATLSAETTKVLGVTRTADGAGNLLTSNSSTYTAKFGLDGNLLGTLGTAFSTAGKVDVKGADGDVFVRQATATNLKAQAECYQGGAAVSASNALFAQNVAGATGGASIYHVISAASTNAANVKASAGTLYGWSIFNTATTPRYVKLHNTAATPTVGAGVVYTIAVPGSTANGAGTNMDVDVGLAFATGIGISIVTGIADADTAAVGASEVAVNLHYK